MLRGEIWWAELPDPAGAGPGYRRPVVVVSSDQFNPTRIATVVVVPLSSNLSLAEAPGNVLLHAEETMLPRQGVAVVSQIIAVDKHLLQERVTDLPANLVALIDQGLRIVLDL